MLGLEIQADGSWKAEQPVRKEAKEAHHYMLRTGYRVQKLR